MNTDIFKDLEAKLASGEILSVFGAWGESFAHDILAKYKRYGIRLHLSSKQVAWAEKLAACVPIVRESVAIDASGILAMFKNAAHALKYPKIRLRTTDNLPVCLSLAGPRSKYVGSVQVTDGGRYGENRYYGRIDPATGSWILPASGAPDSVKLLVQDMGKNPVETARNYGRMTGNCCFCATGLKDERSTSVGYGPVCAKHWGLPWGE